jgi:hypothetical protein
MPLLTAQIGLPGTRNPAGGAELGLMEPGRNLGVAFRITRRAMPPILGNSINLSLAQLLRRLYTQRLMSGVALDQPEIKSYKTLNPMKISRIVLAALFALAASANTLRAVPLLPTFSFHENGNGRLELPAIFGGGIIPLPGTLTTDPGPGGLLSALAFTAHPQVNPFPVGDVVVLDAGGQVSDILRFDEATSSPSGLTQLIFFYSNDHGVLLADTGLPSSMFTNTVTIQENPSGPTIYTPAAGQPGFSSDSPLGDSFRIFSTPDTGSTLLLLGAAIAGFVLLRWKLPAV